MTEKWETCDTLVDDFIIFLNLAMLWKKLTFITADMTCLIRKSDYHGTKLISY